MASIRKLPSGSYQVPIRRAGMPAVTRSFSKKRDTEAFVRTDEGDSELARKLGRGGRPLTGSTINRYKSKLSAVFIHFILRTGLSPNKGERPVPDRLPDVHTPQFFAAAMSLSAGSGRV